MAKREPLAQPGNLLLARLPAGEYQQLLPLLRHAPLEFKHLVYEVEAPIDYAYFPLTGVLSAVTIMDDGSSIEVATVGKEGMVGLPFLLDVDAAPHKVLVQVSGAALRIGADDLKRQTQTGGMLAQLLKRYHVAFFRQVAQSVACNGLHHLEKRCCRWLLETRDRVDSDELPLTQEFLAGMLGVQRSSVAEVLQPLRERGLIRTGRGVVTIVDRKGLEATSCECYRRVREYFDRLLGGLSHKVT